MRTGSGEVLLEPGDEKGTTSITWYPQRCERVQSIPSLTAAELRELAAVLLAKASDGTGTETGISVSPEAAALLPRTVIQVISLDKGLSGMSQLWEADGQLLTKLREILGDPAAEAVITPGSLMAAEALAGKGLSLIMMRDEKG